MPVIEIIALFFGMIAFVMTLAWFAKLVQDLPSIDGEVLTNMLFSAIVCLVSVGVIAYAEVIK